MTLFQHSAKEVTDNKKLGFLMNTNDSTSFDYIILEIMDVDCYTYENAF